MSTCEKNGCTSYGVVVRELRAVLCDKHEAALWRHPEIVRLEQDSFLQRITIDAYVHSAGGHTTTMIYQAEEASRQVIANENATIACIAHWLTVPDTLLVNRLVPLIPLIPAPSVDPEGPDDNGGNISMYGAPPPPGDWR